MVGCDLPAESQFYKDILGNRLIILEKISQQSVNNLLLNADYLVNIGNSIINTLPSKIFEYFNACRPIINFYKSPNCPTLRYTERYPNCINIYEDDEIFKSNIIELKNFIKMQLREITFNEIRDIFNDCTVDNVGEKFDLIISNKRIDEL
jgi:hypothetical protein